MAGRGRGKAVGTLTQEQLQSLGVTSKEIQAVTSAAPPPLYPPLQSKPVPLECNADRSYKILWKEDFISYLRESSYYTTKKCSKLSIQRYSDKVINVIENDPKVKRDGEFMWKTMPAELKPSFKRVKHTNNTQGKVKISRTVEDIDARLNALERKETSGERMEMVKKEKSDSEDEKDREDLEEEVPNDEMDDDNDYGNNYFDNGEAYNDEDDNLDDGPVY
ncbi:DNA-directed RNA polymerase III subunit RPC7-like [Anopheles ziemanni]|uniref:DNA-directed RNA polymerase III subunit RPC7-like n=1 Tax=Anopheles coustani TaxID=139045 RepID=UPI00265A03C7|nr:DNA-directed RNA polymerase III subunit RPC7-like [Anopheles coustani]XP_058174856.1 DNA-directed RNA polymerase III subunit RPC7-like [Anopheles ziemanni]